MGCEFIKLFITLTKLFRRWLSSKRPTWMHELRQRERRRITSTCPHAYSWGPAGHEGVERVLSPFPVVIQHSFIPFPPRKNPEDTHTRVVRWGRGAAQGCNSENRIWSNCLEQENVTFGALKSKYAASEEKKTRIFYHKKLNLERCEKNITFKKKKYAQTIQHPRNSDERIFAPLF